MQVCLQVWRMEDASGLDVLERLHKAAETATDNELAKRLGLSRQSIAKARATKSVPPAWIPRVATLFDVTTDWLFFGRGPMRIGAAIEQRQDEPTDTPATETAHQATCPRCAKLEAKLEISEEERRELSAENRRLYQEKSILERENGDLREKVARLEERKRGYDRAHGLPAEDRLG